MNYIPEDTIDWQVIRYVDLWLDEEVPAHYQGTLAQDWARISKIGEELGEAIQAFIGFTGQNPRKGETHTMDQVLNELADTALTAIFAMQHLTKDDHEVREILRNKQAFIYRRAIEDTRQRHIIHER